MDITTAMQVYKDLADWYERQGQAAMRDRFLILAAEAAFSAGKRDEAERLRQRLLQGNPHHMLKPFNSFAQALQSTNVQIYVHDLQVNYPPETAERLLQDLRGGVSSAPLVAEKEENTLRTEPEPTIPLTKDEPTLPLGAAIEPLKVYPLRNETEPTASSPPPVKPTHLNRPAPRKTTSAAPVNPPPRPAPPAQPLRPRSPAPRPDFPPTPPEPIAPAGAWLTLILFGMTVTAGIALVFHALARPFLPLW
ncbi:MAG: hypothetical protein ACYC3I_10980 [Gemmataceae bacterium]